MKTEEGDEEQKLKIHGRKFLKDKKAEGPDVDAQGG